MADGGMEVLKAAGQKAEDFISFGLDFKSFVNKHEGFITGARQEVGKPLDTVTNSDVDAYFGQVLSTDQRTSAKAFMEVAQDMIDTVKDIRDKLPVNDIE